MKSASPCIVTLVFMAFWGASFWHPGVLAEDAKRLDWSIDVVTRQLEKRSLREVMHLFQEAARKPVASRKSELEKCYVRCHSDFPNAPEVDLIYACHLIESTYNPLALAHLDQKVKGALVSYWPVRRLAIYLRATVADKHLPTNLEEFSADLVAREKRPEVLALNVEWLGQAIEGLRLSAPDDPKVQNTVLVCERMLQNHAASFNCGKVAAAEMANALESAAEAKTSNIKIGKVAIQGEIESGKAVIDEKKEQLKKATDTLAIAEPVLLDAAKPYLQSMAMLEPQIINVSKELSVARKSYDQEVNNKSSEKRDLERAREKVQKVEVALVLLKREYGAAEQKCYQLGEEFKKKYSSELKIAGRGPIDLRKRAAEQKKREQALKQLGNREHATVAYHAKDFLRPQIDQVLADIARTIDND